MSSDDSKKRPLNKPSDGSEEGERPATRRVRPELPDHRWDKDAPSAPMPGKEPPSARPPSDSDEAPPPNLDGMDFTPPPVEKVPTENIAGHDVTEITHEELVRMHAEETGGAPLWESSMGPNHEAIQHARRAQQRGVLEEEVDQLTPAWMRERQVQSPQEPNQAIPNRDTTQVNLPEVDMGNMQSVADAIRVLNKQAAQAQAEGNLIGARALREAMEAISSASEMKRKYEPQEEHNVLTKLKSTLGIKKIKPVSKEWAGLKWNFYASNMVLDAWLIDNLWDDRRNFSALKVATNCVGLDDVSLYQVFNVPLVQIQQVVTEEGDLQEIPIKPYRKYCKSCGIEVAMDAEQCVNCNANLDPYDVPLPLRLYCAERLYNFFQTEFGPTEKLDDLVGMVREELSDRLVDSAELYPLAMLSIEAPKMDGSVSGEGPLPEQESSPQTPEQ